MNYLTLEVEIDHGRVMAKGRASLSTSGVVCAGRPVCHLRTTTRWNQRGLISGTIIKIRPVGRFRCGPQSQNIFTVDQGDQLVTGRGVLLPHTEPNPTTVSFDLTSVYKNTLKSLTQEGSLKADGTGVITDTWELLPATTPHNAVCQFLTTAQVQTVDQGVLLSSGSRQVLVKIEGTSPPTTNIQIADSLIQSYDSPNSGLTRVQFLFPATPGKQSSTLFFVPSGKPH